MKTLHKYLYVFIFIGTLVKAQNYPGGVTGAEVWYQANWEGISQANFINFAQTNIKIDKCGERYEKDLFNFNPSIYSEELCLKYTSSLENTTGRNVFFVGEPGYVNISFSHLGTLWNSEIQHSFSIDSIQRNFFDFNTKNLYAREILENYTSDNNAQVNFYHTNNYNIDKKFKSYGQKGETDFFIGKKLDNPERLYFEDKPFYGRFPEFISYTRELSDNERQRVESYLGLKYGLTLSSRKSYINSKNLVFWNTTNNGKFPNRVFGFGKDKTSSLNQLQSESTHLKNHLVSAIEEIMETNVEKQERLEIPNNHFLVFGDNGGKTDFFSENEDKIKFWEKVWLAQRTGRDIHKFPIHFKLKLTNQMGEYLKERQEEAIWLLQDNFIGNDEVSEFNDETIKYYRGEVNFDEGYAYFKDIIFDEDASIYDQFTFGVGPQMIVQALVEGCKKKRLQINLEITGGKPVYFITVQSEIDSFEFATEGPSYSFPAEAGVTYYITVSDEQGLVSQLEITPEPWGFWVGFDSVYYLSEDEPEIILDAGEGISDPNAVYQWYKDEVLMPNPNNNSTLLVTEVGYYHVIVTSADQSCMVEAKTHILNKGFDARLTVYQECANEYTNSLLIEISGGMPPFTTNISEQEGSSSLSYVHSGTTTLTDISFGIYDVTITDSMGNTFTQTIEFLFSEELNLDIYAQLEAICQSDAYCIDYDFPDAPFFHSTSSNFTIDASIGINTPNVTYEWFRNDQSFGLGPMMGFAYSNSEGCIFSTVSNYDVFTVVATDNTLGCEASQSFIAPKYCPVNPKNSVRLTEKEKDVSNRKSIATKVYPNPSKQSEAFNFEVAAEESFEGTVAIYTVSGIKLRSLKIKGKSKYQLSFDLPTSGVYFIRTTTSLGTTNTDRIIIK